MINIRTFFLAIILFLPALGFAQGSNVEDELLTNEQRSRERYILNSAAQTSAVNPVSNAVIIEQEGSHNRVETNQQHTGNLRNPNIIAVMQSGNLNTTTLDQSGEGNKGIVNQRGSGNDYEGRIYGNNNSTYAEQSGRNNNINQDLAGDDMQYRLIQRGNNNQINQYENGTQNKGYEVIQQGSGMHITITNGF